MRTARKIFLDAEWLLANKIRRHPEGAGKVGVKAFSDYVNAVANELVIKEFNRQTEASDVLHECIKAYLEKVGGDIVGAIIIRGENHGDR